MSKVLGFMKQVAYGLQMEGNFGTALAFIAAVSMPLLLIGKEMILPSMR